MYEYKVIRAPEEPKKGLLGRNKMSYADMLTLVLNEMGSDGWEYQRAETSTESETRLMVFRKPVRKLAEALPELRFSDDHEASPRAEVRPRRGRNVMDEAKGTEARERAAQRRVVVEKPEPAPARAKTDGKANVSELLAARIAKAKG